MKCAWAYDTTPAMRTYHDDEWGNPQHDDQRLFELLSLEIFQAGLSWQTILQKRPALRQAFATFNIDRVAAFGPLDVDRLVADPAIIRNRRKILAVINNAQVCQQIKREQSLDEYFWRMVGGEPIINHWHSPTEVPAQTALAQTISQVMKKRGFKFVGPKIIYSFMQASGMVNDHLDGCSRKFHHD